MTPKPPPTSGAMTRTCSSDIPSALAMALRTAKGTCVESHTVKSLEFSSCEARTARGSMGMPATRG